MAKTLFENGTPLTPETLNRLNNPTYAENPSNDGEIPYPPANLIPEIAALQDGLAQEAATRDSGFRANSTAIEALQDGLAQEATARDNGFRANSSAIEALQARVFPAYTRVEVSGPIAPVPNYVYEITRVTSDDPAVIPVALADMDEGESFIIIGRGVPGSSLDSAVSFPYAWGGNDILVQLAQQAVSRSIRLTRYGSGYFFE